MKTRRRDRHRSRRAHLPCRHRRPRARHSGRGRRRRRDQCTARPEPSSRCPAPRARSAMSTPGSLPFEVNRVSTDRAAAAANPDHGQSRQSRTRLSHRDAAQRRRRPRAHGVHHQRAHRRPSDGAGPPRQGGIGKAARGDCPADAGLQLADRFLRRKLVGRRRHDRRRLLSEAGDRAAVRLQDQRICQPARRRRVRAQGRQPDARLPRRLALRAPGLCRGLCARMRGAEAGARRHGADAICASWCRSAAASRRGGA